MSQQYIKNDEINERPTEWASFKALWKYTRGDRRKIFTAVSLLIVASSTGVLSAFFMSKFIDQGIVAKNLSQSYRWFFSIITLEFLSVSFLYFGRKILAKASLGSVFRIREKLFRHLQKLPASYFDSQPQGRTITRMTHDVESIESFFGGTLARLMTAFFTILIVLVAMFLTHLRLSIFLLISVLPAVLFAVLTRGPLRHWNREYSKRSSSINSLLSEYINGLFVIRSFGAEEWSLNKFNKRVKHFLKAALKINQLNAFARPFVLFLSVLPIPVLLYFGGQMYLASAISLGVFVTFIRYVERFSRPLFMISHELHVVQTALAGAERVTTFLNEKEEADHFEAMKNSVNEDFDFSGELEFQNLFLRYSPEGAWVLQDLSFKISSGEKIGLVGRTGSGKTSAVVLLARLYENQKGKILLDGIEIDRFSKKKLRSLLGFITQEVVVFRGSLRENLLMGLECNEFQLAEAIEQSGFKKIMRKNSWDLDFEVLEKGANLSVGEKQLLSLTRVFLQKPKVLILDEATANIDPETEWIIQKALEDLMRGRTCLFIAHRLDTLKNCDRIFVFESGRIVEKGASRELIQNQSSAFYQLYQKGLQAGA